MQIKVKHTDSTEEIIDVTTSMVSPAGPLIEDKTTDDQEITISYQGRTAKLPITVRSNLTELRLAKEPTGNQYTGTKINFSGLQVLAVYEGPYGTEKTVDVTNYITLEKSKETWDDIGTYQSVKFTYKKIKGEVITTKTCLWNKTLIQKEVDVREGSVKVSTPPNTTSYVAGTLFNPQGAIIQVRYNSGEIKEIPSTEFPTSGVQVLTNTITLGMTFALFEYTENGNLYQCTTPIEVVEKAMTEISIKKNPTKLSYYVGDTINLSGMELTASYNDGTSKTITGGFKADPNVLNISGTVPIQISYSESGITKTTSYSVTSNEVLPSQLRYSGTWAYPQYTNRDVDYSGLNFTLVYNNGKTERVNPTSYSPTVWSPTIGNQNCVFTYATENMPSVSVSISANVISGFTGTEFCRVVTPSTFNVTYEAGAGIRINNTLYPANTFYKIGNVVPSRIGIAFCAAGGSGGGGGSVTTGGKDSYTYNNYGGGGGGGAIAVLAVEPAKFSNFSLTLGKGYGRPAPVRSKGNDGENSTLKINQGQDTLLTLYGGKGGYPSKTSEGYEQTGRAEGGKPSIAIAKSLANGCQLVSAINGAYGGTGQLKDVSTGIFSPSNWIGEKGGNVSFTSVIDGVTLTFNQGTGGDGGDGSPGYAAGGGGGSLGRGTSALTASESNKASAGGGGCGGGVGSGAEPYSDATSGANGIAIFYY